MNALTPVNNLTMSSREIAELVEKRHDNVKRTIEMLAEKQIIRSPQIEETEEINNLGLPRKISHYVFTGEQGKRDSIVIVAQLSPEFTARLVDRWQELESQIRQKTLVKENKPLPPSKQAKEALSVMERAFRTLHKLGFDKNSAILSANQYTRKHAQIDVLADTGNTHLIAENQTSIYYNPTELGKLMGGLSPQKMNKLLETAGLQTKQAGHWRATSKGQQYSRLFDTLKQHGNGTPIPQTKWANSVLPVLQAD